MVNLSNNFIKSREQFQWVQNKSSVCARKFTFRRVNSECRNKTYIEKLVQTAADLRLPSSECKNVKVTADGRIVESTAMLESIPIN